MKTQIAEAIVAASCAALGIDRADLAHNTCYRDIGNARAAIVYYVRDTVGLSFPQIGELVGLSDSGAQDAYRRHESPDVWKLKQKLSAPVRQAISTIVLGEHAPAKTTHTLN
jgi:hypothetical protein